MCLYYSLLRPYHILIYFPRKKTPFVCNSGEWQVIHTLNSSIQINWIGLYLRKRFEKIGKFEIKCLAEIKKHFPFKFKISSSNKPSPRKLDKDLDKFPWDLKKRLFEVNKKSCYYLCAMHIWQTWLQSCEWRIRWCLERFASMSMSKRNIV